jgi:hypothetical protein
MRSIFCFIIEPKEDRYTNVKDHNGEQLILNTELQNYQYVSRHGIVKSVPAAKDTKIKEGDEVIVHHNVFRRFHDIRGKEKNGKAYYDENTFIVESDQIFLYKRDGRWNAPDGYCFVKPIKSSSMFTTDHERPLTGFLKYADEKLLECNVPIDSLVGFVPGSEYEFIVEGQRLYRVPTNLISIKYECKGDEEEYNPSWA